MDTAVSRALQDKLYDKRKAGALELEAIIRTALKEDNHEKIEKIVHQLCHEYAYAVHQPHARNGGLIGLAAAAIALGSEVSPYLREIVPPVLACFSDQDARVRYYACESMYNIAKVAKGDILLYFNDVFDALCKLSADTELSVKNGAELLDRLVKDIVSESAATYASMILPAREKEDGDDGVKSDGDYEDEDGVQTAFSLRKFIPLLQERIHVMNAFTRTFLVSWITLLDSIPDLELVAYLPSFLGGLLRFLTDPNTDVHTMTKTALARFLNEIVKIAAVKKGISQSRKSRERSRRRKSTASSIGPADQSAQDKRLSRDSRVSGGASSRREDPHNVGNDDTGSEHAVISIVSGEDEDDQDDDLEDEWIPGQDVKIDYPQILDILITFLSEWSQEEIQTTTLRWIETFLDICPADILMFTPRLLAHILPALSHEVDIVKKAANRVNSALMAYVMSLPAEPARSEGGMEPGSSGQVVNASQLPVRAPVRTMQDQQSASSRRDPTPSSVRSARNPSPPEAQAPRKSEDDRGLDQASSNAGPYSLDFDYEAAVTSLTLQFLHEHEATRVAALAWLIMLHRKSPRKILADGTFPALLKTLSDPSEAVVIRDLVLLSQISKNSEDSYFTSFMVNLLKLLSSDRRLLETRGNLIIRQSCLSLSAERIYRTMADILEREEEDTEFASIMVQNLNNNLITAPQLADLRKRLRNLDTRDGQTFFTVLFRAWCVNSVATFSLCLLAQAYEQAYNLLQIFAEIEMTVTMLIQIDKLVQLLESPVFTYLRMQLIEPERYPYLYKCMYGVLMLLPQSSAFAALKNRLNSVAPIGYLQMASGANRGQGGQGTALGNVSTFERQNRLKARDEGGIRWNELLEKFRSTQDRLRRLQQRALAADNGDGDGDNGYGETREDSAGDLRFLGRPGSAASLNNPLSGLGVTSAGVIPAGGNAISAAAMMPPPPPPAKHKGFAQRLSSVTNRSKSKKT